MKHLHHTQRATWLLFGALALMWAFLSLRLAGIWETNSQYSHGWLVPFLAGWDDPTEVERPREPVALRQWFATCRDNGGRLPSSRIQDAGSLEAGS